MLSLIARLCYLNKGVIRAILTDAFSVNEQSKVASLTFLFYWDLVNKRHKSY